MDMANSNVRIKVRRRKVAQLAAYSRKHTVKNCTIRVANEDAIKRQGSWDIPKEGFPQYKNLRKRIHGQKWIKHKDGTEELKKWDYSSEFPNIENYQKKLWKNMGKAAKMEAYTQDKLKKWEKKHPKPCPTDDLFKDEFIPVWEKEREEALIRIRDFVVSMFDKVPLTGRFKISENKYEEEKLADLKAKNGEGHKVNELKKDSKLLKTAQKTVDKVHAKRTNFIAGHLLDHKRQKGRMILPKAA